MEPTIRQALEAILFVVDEPVDVSTLSQVLEVGRTDVEVALRDLGAELERDRRGFVLREVAGGWRLFTAPDAAAYVERWVLLGRSGRLSQAALESLAVVAYKQPISRHEVSEIRGVNADAALRTLLSRGLIEEVGRDSGPGQAILYGTTSTFLERIGAQSLDDLPAMTDYLEDGQAPDEPSVHDLAGARARMRAGDDLATTTRPPDREMEDLSGNLEQVARSAMATLEEAMRAVEEASSDPPPEADES
jgi:segregation and condensation protein B